jgi:hypothetical protein
MKRDFNYSRNNVECVTVNQWVATRRADGARKHPVIGKLLNGKVIPNNYYGKL